MAKKSNDKKLNMLLGLALIIAAIVGIGKIIEILVILLGVYFIYQGLKK